MRVLEIKGLKKKIGKREIIKNLNLSLEAGEIYGFLGPNGAGKTTTIRMIVGLINPTEGEIKICGKDIGSERAQALKNVGAVVENPELYKYLSGRENLMQIARVRKVSKEEVEELIKLVGLENRIMDKVKKYSLGMKQRLGIAAALIGNPKLLILDEPTNGLDPSGIIDFRNVVKKAAKEKNIAVFVSSHILSEIEQICDKVAFVNDGVIKSVEDTNMATENIKKESLTVVLDDINRGYEILKIQPFVTNVTKMPDSLNIVIQKDSNKNLLRLLVEEDFEVREIYKNREGLEQRYMELVEGGIR